MKSRVSFLVAMAVLMALVTGACDPLKKSTSADASSAAAGGGGGGGGGAGGGGSGGGGDADVHRAYVISKGTVWVCPLGAGGALGSCAATDGGGGWGTSEYTAPDNIVVNTIGGSTYAYIPDSSVGYDVWICLVSPIDGTLSGCATNSGGQFWAPYDISFLTVGGTTYAYVADVIFGSGAGIWSCTVSPTDGTLGSCTEGTANDDYDGSGHWGFIQGVAAATLGGASYVYVPDAPDATLAICAVSSTDGTVGAWNGDSGCGLILQDGATYWEPSLVRVNVAGGATTVYTVDAQTGNIYACAASAANQGAFPGTRINLGACPMTNVSGAYPDQLAFLANGGTTYGYIADSVNGVWLCSVSATDGTLGSCALSNGGITIGFPFGIAVQ